MAVSAAQGLGTGDLLDRLVELLPARRRLAEEDEDLVRLAIIGRPNVGKSSLVNPFLGHERVIVSDVAGTTRDAIDIPLEVDGRRLLLVDTAGIRRQAKVRIGRVLHGAALPARRRARRRRARRLRRERRRHLPGHADRRAGDEGGLRDALVLNKWDLTSGDEYDLDHERATVRPASCACDPRSRRSAADRAQRGAPADRGARRSPTAPRHRIPTPELNRFLADAVDAAPAAGEAGPPPQAALHGPDRDAPAALRDPGQQPPPLTRDYAYFIENRLRERYGMDGVPLIIDLPSASSAAATA